jgi:hypothetical protein
MLSMRQQLMVDSLLLGIAAISLMLAITEHLLYLILEFNKMG